MIVYTHTDPEGVPLFDSGGLAEFFTPGSRGGDKASMGAAILRAGAEGGWSQHQGDEYSYVVSGSLLCYTEDGQRHEAGPGSAIFTPAGQRHKSANPGNTDAMVIWLEVR